MYDILLYQVVLNEVNFNYENELLRFNSERIPQCYVLMGTVEKEKNNLTQLTIKKCINTPLRFNKDPYILHYEEDELSDRLDLVKTVDQELTPVGVLVVNDKQYDYKELTKRLEKQFNIISYVEFRYTPHAQVKGNQELNLQCFQQNTNGSMSRRVDYQLIRSKIKITTKEADPFELTDAFALQEKKEAELVSSLTIRIDRIITYLKNAPESDSNDIILRQISLLVARLRRPTSSDIELELLEKENEIRLLQVACNQWEMANPY